MMFEDAHWADPSSLELLDIAIAPADEPASSVGRLVSPGIPAAVGWPAVASLITLRRLTQKQAAQLAERTVVERALPLTLLERIVTQTDGVPLFIEELTKAVLEGAEQSDRRRGTARSAGHAASLADGAARSASGGKQVAQIGAVIGREFAHALLAAVARMPEAQLARASIRWSLPDWPSDGLPPDADYTFKHALVRDAAYSTLLRSQRQELHARIGKPSKNVSLRLSIRNRSAGVPFRSCRLS